MDNIQIINTIITQLDTLAVQGARNMTVVLNCIQQLIHLKDNINGGAENVQDQTE